MSDLQMGTIRAKVTCEAQEIWSSTLNENWGEGRGGWGVVHERATQERVTGDQTHSDNVS